MSGYTKGPWKFRQMDGFDELHKLRGTTPEPHEGYFRENNGDWVVTFDDSEGGGRIAAATFKGKAKRGQAWTAPDPEGQANARLIAAAPELLEALKEIESVMRMYGDGMFGGPLAKTIRAAIAKAEVL